MQRLSRMRSERVPTAEIATLQAAVALFQPLLMSWRHERLCVAYLDASDRLLDVGMHTVSADATVPLPFRALMQEALRLEARSVVVAHNHPSGDPTPSEADRKATRLLVEACRSVDIRVYDHLIIAGDRVTSLRAEGMM